jgi:hypothetical protein
VKVRDILCRLQSADPDAVVLYMPAWADTTDAEEINEVAIVREAWTCERHRAPDGTTSDVHHPSDNGLSFGWNESTDKEWPERVVILSSVPGATYG